MENAIRTCRIHFVYVEYRVRRVFAKYDRFFVSAKWFYIKVLLLLKKQYWDKSTPIHRCLILLDCLFNNVFHVSANCQPRRPQCRNNRRDLSGKQKTVKRRSGEAPLLTPSALPPPPSLPPSLQETVSTGPFMMRSACRRCGGRGSIMTTPCVLCRGSGQTKQRQTVKVPVPAGTSKEAVRASKERGTWKAPRVLRTIRLLIRWLCYVVSVIFYFRTLQEWRTARLCSCPLGRRKSLSRSGLVGLI